MITPERSCPCKRGLLISDGEILRGGVIGASMGIATRRREARVSDGLLHQVRRRAADVLVHVALRQRFQSHACEIHPRQPHVGGRLDNHPRRDAVVHRAPGGRDPDIRGAPLGRVRRTPQVEPDHRGRPYRSDAGDTTT